MTTPPTLGWHYLDDPALGLVEERRPLQVALAQYLSEAVTTRQPSMSEAGTGIGKSYTYLLAARDAVARGEHVAISTGMRSLQQQLFRKDLPRLAAFFSEEKLAFGRQLGKANYGCRRRVDNNVFLRQEREVYDAFFAQVPEWVWEDAPEEIGRKLPQTRWQHSVAYCNPERCDFSDACGNKGYLRAMADALHPLVVVNHALIGADMRVWRQHGVRVVKNTYTTLFIDEAHKFPDAIRDALACQMPQNFFDRAKAEYAEHLTAFRGDLMLTLYNVNTSIFPKELPDLSKLHFNYQAMFREVQRTGGFGSAAAAFSDVAARACQALEIACATGTPALGAFLRGGSGGYGERAPAWATPELRQVESAMKLLYWLDSYQSKLLAFRQAISDANADKLGYAVGVTTSPQGKSEIRSIPVHVGPSIAAFFEEHKITPHYLSATLAVDGRFEHFAQEVGYDLRREGATFIAGTPFNLKKQAWCYAPSTLPNPGQHGYMPAVIDECYDLLLANEGHAFILFTSYNDLRAVEHGLQEKGYPYPLLVQSPELKARGRELFLATPHATLLGTRSFWEGIDIPGLHLSLVIIPKVPFPIAGDPVIKAKCASAGDEWFQHVHMPLMLMDLRQMAGRLIRSTSDLGVVALLDSRVHTKKYGNALIRAVNFPWNNKKDTALRLLGQISAKRKQGA